MQRLPNIGKSLVDSGGSTVDGNRLYSILLDARASKVSENMFDVAENLLNNEKDNAKTALEQLWALKRNLQPENETGTVDLLIRFYQDKINVLRNKEEIIKRVSTDSRALLEEKRKRDSEIASVKQEISDCSGEIERLNSKLQKLKVKEQELTLVEMQVKRELQGNANEVVNGLYEIILSQQAIENGFAVQQAEPESSQHIEPYDEQQESATEECETPTRDETDVDVETLAEKSGDESAAADDVVALKHIEMPSAPPFPKSVVKTTRGTVIGEYFYDPKVYKLNRHYIFNSDFLREQLSLGIRALRDNFDQARYVEALRMIEDASKRIQSENALHFEVSTNEILNAKTLKELYVNMRTRNFDEVLKVCNRLGAKIAALGGNYYQMLQEQMQRLTAR